MIRRTSERADFFFFISYLCLMNITNCRLSATFQNPNYSWTQLLAIHNKVEEKKKIQRFVCLPLCTTRMLIRQWNASCSFSVNYFSLLLNLIHKRGNNTVCFNWNWDAECDKTVFMTQIPVFHIIHLFHEKGTSRIFPCNIFHELYFKLSQCDKYKCVIYCYFSA